ncbi:kinase-like protein, partial [Amniculicola lignicola CBS 123094]
VFICLDNVTNKYVIKKKLTDKDIRSGLGKRELNALKQLNHENINRFVDGYVDKERMTGSIYLEYCDQGTLYDLIKAHARSHSSLPEGFLIRVLDGVVAGIRYMHKGPSGQSNRQWNTLVHRDLKPANIFLKASQNPYPRAVIGDFGCCASDSDLRSGRATETVERQDPRFAPPEAPRYYRSSDIFQIGMIIVCMARLENEVSRSTRVEHGRPLGWGYSAEINHVVQKCILPDPEQRIRTSELVPVLD